MLKSNDNTFDKAIIEKFEKIPSQIEQDINKIKKMMGNFKTGNEKQTFLKIMIKHFNKEKLVAEKTIEKIKNNGK